MAHFGSLKKDVTRRRRVRGCGQLFFGGRNDKAYGFEGRLDEAAIYNRALSAKEIAEHVAAAGK